MLPENIKSLSRRLIEVELACRQKKLFPEALETLMGEIASKGFAFTAGSLLRITEACSTEMETRAAIVWQQLLRVISNLGISPYNDMARDLKGEWKSHLEVCCADLTAHLMKKKQLITPPPANISLSEARDRIVKKYEAEIDLFAESMMQTKQSSAGNGGPKEGAKVFNFYSPVGSVQTGDHSTASVLQVLSPTERESVVKSLQMVREALKGVESLPASPKHELVEMIGDAESEVRKEKPNFTRLKTTLMVIATAIQTAGNLKPAYEALKVCLVSFGISLP